MENIAFSLPPRASFTYRMPTIPYLFRHDRGAFWSLRVLASVLANEAPFFSRFLPSIEEHALLRFIFSAIIPNSSVFSFVTNLVGFDPLSRTSVAQDFYIPPDAVPGLFTEMEQEWGGAWPVWICPVRKDARIGKLFSADYNVPGKEKEESAGFCVNIGVYAVPERYKDYNKDWRGKNRNIERFVAKVGGRKGLYAQCLWENENEFWKNNYDRQEYERVRKARKAEGNFMGIYEKITAREKK